MDYCAECQKAIDEALNKIPVKFGPKYMEVDDKRLLRLFNEIREKVEKDRKEDENHWPELHPILPTLCSKYDIVERYTHKGREYLVEYDEDKPEEKHVTILAEYDLIKKKFTGNAWIDEKSHKDTFIRQQNPWKALFREQIRSYIPSTPMDEPSGKVFFNDFLGNEPFFWDVKTPITLSVKTPEHILRKYSINYSGKNLLDYINKKVEDGIWKLRPTLELFKFEQILEYNLEFEKYDDEQFEWLIDITID